MGYGGALIWTGLAKNLRRKYPDKRIVFVYSRRIRDYLLNRQYGDNVIYENNDDIFLAIDNLGWLLKKYSLPDKNFVVVNLDRALYCEKVLKDKVIYRHGDHSIALISRDFGVDNPILETKLVLKKEEEERAAKILIEAGLEGGKFICLEPNAKKGFTPNKEWPWENWQELARRISDFIVKEKLNIKLAQVGVAGAKILDGAVDLTGKTTFRETRGIIEKSLFFIVTEGGLAHLAASIPKKSFVLISAMMPKELMAYPNNVNFYTEVECQNCGLTVPCPNNLKCMKQITVDQVYAEIEKEIRNIFNLEK